jgi:hypothetical protein
MAAEDEECPLCVEPLELADKIFEPCECGFKVSPVLPTAARGRLAQALRRSSAKARRAGGREGVWARPREFRALKNCGSRANLHDPARPPAI